MKTERTTVIQRLAHRHYLFEPNITEIREIVSDSNSPADEPIRLLEVNENTVPSGVMPLGFDAFPESGVPYPSVIVEVTPEEYERIKSNELKLPVGWALGDLVPRPIVNGSSHT